MDVTSAPRRPHTTEARAGPRRSELGAEVIALFLLVFLPAEAAQQRILADVRHSE